jgi:hypothetical protein
MCETKSKIGLPDTLREGNVLFGLPFIAVYGPLQTADVRFLLWHAKLRILLKGDEPQML